MDSETKIKDLERRMNELEKALPLQRPSKVEKFGNASLNSLMDINTRNSIQNTISEYIHKVLWENIFYTSSFLTAAITTTATEVLNSSGRESDTSAGKRFTTKQEGKFKCAFYLNTSVSKAVVYITSPAVSTSSVIGTSINSSEKSYAGIRIVAGELFLVVSRGGEITTKTTKVVITDNTTHILEIDYYINHIDVFFNSEFIGSITCNFVGIDFQTFFPFLTSVGSSDGTSVNLTIESYEFLQKRSA